MSVSHLTTTWLCVCAEGKTLDGRDIERQWILDAVELYNPRMYTAQLWPEHSRTYGPVGQVLELKAEKDEDGVLKMFARLCPALSLIAANGEGKLLFTSAEFTEDGNFRGTGKSYLEGMGVTDEPASVYTDQMKFNKRLRNKRYSQYRPIVFDDIKKTVKGNSVKGKKKWYHKFGLVDENDTTTETNNDITDDAATVLAEQLKAAQDKISELETQLAELKTSQEETDSDVETIKEVVDTKEFAQLRDNLPQFIQKLGSLDKKFTKLPSKKPSDSRKPFEFL
ncbi:TPA: GPO family capsid scaffolding protein [Yersinia enterocolitica]|uniref:GPO family capsid scaffolding protein n=1 Tax=Yersinia enterocolitica TaxID=630 RepID=UPI0002E7F1B7|nr:GPO family capsid scaffolding protein [Yersinia enterocolitica]AJI84230.1 phage capsid scaffolding (GPO) serine peptidase family protein [Yersinia enterocolitica]KGA71113.1 phage capsid scaffolding (GPO) serine peptidase family protein [Yersinia enterocolitica]PNM14152.1 phage capsid protein [Yersinia enterocolitica]CNJ66908.1 putative capsid scaffolding protein [Yersinia enterocolitica]VFS96616.1 putative capsid scaffolding protein from bacteriophage origin [Yersinia enterocolitica]